MGLKHFYKSLKSDPVDATLVGATKWNDDHYFLDATGAPLGTLGDVAYRGTSGAVALAASAQGVFYCPGAGQVPAFSMGPTVGAIIWPSGHSLTGTSGANVTDILGGLNAQILRVFTTVADATNFRYVGLFGNYGATGHPGVAAVGNGTGATANLYVAAQGNVYLVPTGGTVNVTGALTATGPITATAFVVAGGGGETISGAELAVLDGVVPGTVTASKAVVVDANKDIASFRNLTATTVTATTFAGGNVTFAVTGASSVGTAASAALAVYSRVVQSDTGQNLNLRAPGTTTIFFQTNSIDRWGIGSTGTLYPVTDNANQLGSAANRLTSGFFNTAIVVGTNPAATGAIRLANTGTITARNAANTGDASLLSLTVSDITLVTSAAQTVASLGVLSLGTATAVGLLVVTVENSNIGVFLINGAANSVTLVAQTGASYTTVAGTANKLNVYWSAANSRYEFENRFAYGLSPRFVRLGQ